MRHAACPTLLVCTCTEKCGFVCAQGSQPNTKFNPTWRSVLTWGGLALILIGYNATLMFLRIKIPGYMFSTGR